MTGGAVAIAYLRLGVFSTDHRIDMSSGKPHSFILAPIVLLFFYMQTSSVAVNAT